MLNSSFSRFILGSYMHIGSFKYLCAILILFVYMFIVVANLSLIVVICTNRSLHEPMYLFLCSLFINQLYGSNGLFPFLIIQILSDIHTISYSFCYLQIFCFYSYANIEYLTLAVMSYDRYLAICRPLQYTTHMTPKKVGVFIALLWLYSFIRVMITISLSVSLPLCGNVIKSVYCSNYLIVRLACSKATVNNIWGILSTISTIIVPLFPIAFSYMKIILICLSGSDPSGRKKALNTCIPQVVSLVNFSFGCLFEILRTRFDLSSVPTEVQILLTLYFGILQPLLNPLMYGLQMSKIRNTYSLLCSHIS